MTRFQYEPYARRVPALTAADTTGTYSAKVGTGWPVLRGGHQIAQATGPSAPASAAPRPPWPAGMRPGPGQVRGCHGRPPRACGNGAVRAHRLVHHRERVSSQHVLAGDRGQQHLVTGPQAAAAAQRPRESRRRRRAGTVTMPPGSRRAIITPGLGGQGQPVPARASPARLIVARSATRPEASMRPNPYTTPAGTDGAGRPGHRQRPDRRRRDARCPGHAAWGRDDGGDRPGSHGWLPDRGAPAEGGGQRACSSRPPACSSGVPFWGLLTGLGVRGGT